MTIDVDPDTGEFVNVPPGQELGRQLLVETIPATPPFLRSGFNYDRSAASEATGQVNLAPSLTQQQFAEEADINTIVKRFGLTGKLPENARLPSYGDFGEVFDFQTAMNAIRHAEEAFMALPPLVRAEFNNDPQKLIEAVDDPSQRDRLQRLGLLKEVPATPAVTSPSPSEESASGTGATGGAKGSTGGKSAGKDQ